MNASRNAVRFASVLLVLSVSGCDRGYNYQPVDPQGNRLPQWSETVGGVQFSAKPYTTLIGQSAAILYLDIANESDKEAFMLGGQLVTNGRTIEAEVDDSSEGRDARTVSPGASKSVMLFWDLGGSADEVLGPDITWVWRVRIGAAEHSLRVPMQRQQR